MRRAITILGALFALAGSSSLAQAQHPGFPNFGVTLSYYNYLPVFCQPEIPGAYRWGYGQYAASKAGAGYSCNPQGQCPPGYLWCGHGSNFCPGHQPYFPQTIFGQNYSRKGVVPTSPGGGAPAPVNERAQGVGNFGAAYYGGQHGTSQVANPSAGPFYMSAR